MHRLGQKRGLANLAKQWFYNITFPETRPQNSHPEHARSAVISLGGRRVSGTVGHPQLQLLAGLRPTRRCVDRSWCGFEIMFSIRAPVVEAHQRTRRVVGINTDCEGGSCVLSARANGRFVEARDLIFACPLCVF